MTCPHLERTSAAFDGEAAAHDCAECRAFLADAARLREELRGVTFAVAPKRRMRAILVPAAIVLSLLLFLVLRPQKQDSGPFAGLDGGGRAAITVKE